MLGAILMTGFLGGAVFIHVRVNRDVSDIGENIGISVLAWTGLWLRDARIRTLLPIARSAPNLEWTATGRIQSEPVWRFAHAASDGVCLGRCWTESPARTDETMRGRDCRSVSDGFTVGVQLGVELSLLDLGNMATIGAGIGAFLSKRRAVTGAQRMGLGTRQIAFATFVGNAVILTLDPVVDLVAARMMGIPARTSGGAGREHET